MNNTTAILKRAVDFLFVNNPKLTSMGVLFGFILKLLVDVFEPTLKSHSYLNLTGISQMYWVLAGVFLFNIPDLFTRKKVKFSDDIEATIQYIKDAKKNGLSEIQIKKMWTDLYYKIIEQLNVSNDQKGTRIPVKNISEGM